MENKELAELVREIKDLTNRRLMANGDDHIAITSKTAIAVLKDVYGEENA